MNLSLEPLLQEIKKLLVESLKADIELREIAREILQNECKSLNLLEQPISANELRKHLGNAADSTLAKYRKDGMPYLKGSPNRYILSECLKWYNTNRKMYRKSYNH